MGSWLVVLMPGTPILFELAIKEYRYTKTVLQLKAIREASTPIDAILSHSAIIRQFSTSLSKHYNNWANGLVV